MTFQYITAATSTFLSSVRYIWKNCDTNIYYISQERPDSTNTHNYDQQFMLNYTPKTNTIVNPYKNNLNVNICKTITNIELTSGKTFYDGTLWTFSL